MYIYTQHYKGVLVMSWLFPNYSRKNIEIIKGNGCKVYDQNNQEYLDLTSGIGVTK